MDGDLRVAIETYIESLFVEPDPTLERNIADAEAAGLPSIQVSANQGRLLYILTKISGARRVLEIGTLGGYSTTWFARALPDNGTVLSLELDPTHAAVARTSIDRAGIGSRVTIEVGPAAETMQRLIRERDQPFDLIFIDADKPGYLTYLDLSLALSRPGAVIVADNLIRDGAVLNEAVEEENARAARDFNAKLAAEPRLESIIIPVLGKRIDGMSISIVQ
jgi:predicted O-methyltransferase YrrM